MPKYNPGDRVRYVGKKRGQVAPGMPGEVVEHLERLNVVRVKFNPRRPPVRVAEDDLEMEGASASTFSIGDRVKYEGDAIDKLGKEFEAEVVDTVSSGKVLVQAAADDMVEIIAWVPGSLLKSIAT